MIRTAKLNNQTSSSFMASGVVKNSNTIGLVELEIRGVLIEESVSVSISVVISTTGGHIDKLVSVAALESND